jgi:hypothetical protein
MPVKVTCEKVLNGTNGLAKKALIDNKKPKVKK